MWAIPGSGRWRARQGYVAHIASLMSSALHEPYQRARRLAVAQLAQLRRSELETNRVLAQLRRGRVPEFANHASDPSIRALIDYLRDDLAPKVFVTLHTSRMLVGAIRLLLEMPAGLAIQVPIPARSLTALAPLQSLASARGVELDFVPIKRGAAIHSRSESVHAPIVLTMIDLDAAYGRTEPATFLGAAAHFVIGPYVLARRRRAAMIFFDCDSDGAWFDRPLHDCTASDLKNPTALLPHFAARMERTIAADPCAWTRWHALPALRAVPPRGRSAC